MKKKIIFILVIFITIFIYFNINAVVKDEEVKENFANIVLFAHFSDASEEEKEYFNNKDNRDRIIKIYNGSNGKSFKSYMSSISYGKFNVENYFPQDNGKTIDSYELSLTQEEAEKYNHDVSIINELIDNVPEVKDKIIDYNNDGIIDNLTVILNCSDSSNSKMPTTGSHKSTYTGDKTYSNKNIGPYNVLNTERLMTSILSSESGLVAHEFLHTLGYPDLYTKDDTHPVYTWDIMASASAYVQYPLAYLRYKVSNWINIDTIDSSKTNLTLHMQSNKDGNQAYILKSPINDYELFVVEFRKKAEYKIPDYDSIDSKIGGSGLIVYRVNTTVEEYSNYFGETGIYVFRPNINNNEQLDVQQAFLSKESGRTSIGNSDLSVTDNALTYSNGTNSGIVISNISESSNDYMTFDVSIPEVNDLDIWNNLNFNDTQVDNANKNITSVKFNDTKYFVTYANNKLSTYTYTNNFNLINTKEISNDIVDMKLIENNNKLYLIYTDLTNNLYLNELNNNEWKNILVKSNIDSYGCDSISLNNILYLVFNENQDTKLFKLENNNLVTLGTYASIAYGGGQPKITSLDNQIYVGVRDWYNNDNILIYKYDGSFTKITNDNLSSSTYDLESNNNKIYIALGGDNLSIVEYDKDGFKDKVESNVLCFNPELVSNQGNLYILASSNKVNGTTKIYSYFNNEFNEEGLDVDGYAEKITLLSDNKNIIVSYVRSSDKKIYIKQKDTNNSLISLSITVPNKTTYYENEEIDLTGLKVIANYKKGTKVLSENEYQINNFDTKTIGEKVATITYNGVSNYFSYNVIKKEEPVIVIPVYNIENINDLNIPNNAKEGDIIYINPITKFGYKYTGVNIYDTNGNNINYILSSDKKSFIMPNYDIKVSSIYEKKNMNDNISSIVTSTTYNSISIKWEKIEGAKGYVIYRSTNGKKWKLVKTIKNPNTTTYKNTSLSTNTKYYYKVRPYKLNKRKKVYGKYSNVISSTPRLNNTISRGYNDYYLYARVSWNKVSGASGYYVYRSDSINGKYKKIATTTKTNYYDKKAKEGITYYYKILPYRKVGGRRVTGNYSNVSSSMRLSDYINFSLERGYRSIKLIINKLPSAKKYYIYRSTSKNGRYSKVATLNSNSYEGEQIIWTNYKLSKNRTYYYKIKVSNNNTSAFSSKKSARTYK